MMNNKLNLITTLVYQLITILSGLILPRLIISTFGSEINGLVSSINQFLNFISLFEGGIFVAVLAELYLPIENKDDQLISKILRASNDFFKKLSLLFLVYTFILSICYPLFIVKGFSFIYVSSLVLILSINILMQYMFSVTNKILLQADQKLYIPNILSSITVVLNFILTVVIIKLFPSIHLVKIGASIAFLVQPIFYNWYVDKKYHLKKSFDRKYELKNKKDAFSQNFAHYINMNTDIILITTFLTLSDVSVYTVYLLAINALRNIICTAANSYQSALGKYGAQGDMEVLRKKYYDFENKIWIISTILFSTCLLLINPFVSIYTSGIYDANYYQPIFALIMCLAQFIYCIREPYRLLVLSAGKFKETNFGSYMEAFINIILSIILINKYGLIGVAIGTLVAIFFRFIYFMFFLHKDILYLKLKDVMKNCLSIVIMMIFNVYVYVSFPIKLSNFIGFILYGFIIVILESTLYIFIRKLISNLR